MAAHQLASLGLIAVLAALTGFGLWAALAAKDATATLHDTSRVNNAMEDALQGIDEEASLERAYQLSPGPSVRASYLRSATKVIEALDRYAASGDRQNRALAAFLIIDDELDGHARAAGPARVGRIAAVADQITRIIRGGGHRSAGTIWV